MEYICGDLLNLVRKRGKVPEHLAKIVFKQIIEGLKYIHSKGVVHRDIKLDNILIDLKNTIKICDFGVSKMINSDTIMYEHCGTPAYIAPEIYLHQGYEGFQCDVWSAGVTLYYMLSGNQPFKGTDASNIQRSILKDKFKKIEGCSKEANDLLKAMMTKDPKERITIREILAHPWLSNVNVANRDKVDLFTKAEKILYSKFNVNYLTSPIEDLVENFSNKYINTINDDETNNCHTKSVILAPYNSYNFSLNSNSTNSLPKLPIQNGICKFAHKVHQVNLKYEMNNNADYDNGMIISQRESKDNNNMYDNCGESISSRNDSISKQIVPMNDYNNQRRMASEENSEYEELHPLVIKKQIVSFIEKSVGYDKEYLVKCLKNKCINYATATYFLLERDVD